MKLIAHRGNTVGRFESYENEPNYIDKAIREGYDVEVDVWVINGLLYLGHDKAQYGVNFRWFRDRMSKLWIHCKNEDALFYFRDDLIYDMNYFWHQKDDFTLTSHGYIWTYPGKKLSSNSIAVIPETSEFDNIDIAYGICSDNIENYRNGIIE